MTKKRNWVSLVRILGPVIGCYPMVMYFYRHQKVISPSSGTAFEGRRMYRWLETIPEHALKAFCIMYCGGSKKIMNDLKTYSKDVSGALRFLIGEVIEMKYDSFLLFVIVVV